MTFNDDSLKANIQSDDSHMAHLSKSHTCAHKGWERLIYPLAKKQSQICTNKNTPACTRTHSHRGKGLLVDFIKLSSSQATIWGWGPKQRGIGLYVCMCAYYGGHPHSPMQKLAQRKHASPNQLVLACIMTRWLWLPH